MAKRLGPAGPHVQGLRLRLLMCTCADTNRVWSRIESFINFLCPKHFILLNKFLYAPITCFDTTNFFIDPYKFCTHFCRHYHFPIFLLKKTTEEDNYMLKFGEISRQILQISIKKINFSWPTYSLNIVDKNLTLNFLLNTSLI